MTQKEDTKSTSSTKSIYEGNIRLKNGGLKGLNGAYKLISYNKLPKLIKKQDINDKRDQGIVGFRHVVIGTRIRFFITVSVAKTKNVEKSTPTVTVYKKQGKKVTKLYTGTSKYGTLPKKEEVKSTSKETEKETLPLIEVNFNDETNADLIVDAFAGTWYGDEGWDTVFRTDDLQDDFDENAPGDGTKGFVTPYNETVEMHPISFGILNPGVLGRSDPNVGNTVSESIHGIRFFRRVVSTLARVDKNKNFPPPDNNQTIRFPSGTTIHEETGYILFMYEANILKRIVKSLAIPRGITVLAADDTPTVTQDGDIININATLVSSSNPPKNDPWIIGNGEFPTKNGKISSFVQELNVSFNKKDPSSSTFTYTQDTPISLNNNSLGHFNENMLRKQA